MLKNTTIAISFLLMALGSTAQNQEDALRYSTYERMGTARFNAMAGAFGALGGDLSVVSVNPAGLGVYRSSEVSISPTFNVNGTDAIYRGTTNDDSRFSFTINNIGGVGAYDLEKDKWKKAQFGFSYNRLQDFQNNYTISGENASSSFLDVLVDGANGFSPEQLEEDNLGFAEFPAWNTFLLDTIDGATNYYSAISEGTNVEQILDLESRGRIGETTFAGSVNYDDRLYLGVSMGFQRLVYNTTKRYTERVVESTDTFPSVGAALVDYTFSERINADGNGLNLKVGAIYRATDFVRLGLSYHSPTWVTMDTEVTTSISSAFNDGVIREQESAELGLNRYNVTSPHRLISSVAFILGKKALISADYEMVNYSAVRLRSSNAGADIDFRTENEAAQQQFEAGGNLKVGAEYRLDPFSIRLGTAMYDNPFDEQLVDNGGPQMVYTGGVGYRGARHYVDFSYRMRDYNSDLYLYDPSRTEAVALSHTDHSVTLTVGAKF